MTEPCTCWPIRLPDSTWRFLSETASWRGVPASRVIEDALSLLSCETATYLLRIDPDAPVTALADATGAERLAMLEARRARLLDEAMAAVDLAAVVPDRPPDDSG